MSEVAVSELRLKLPPIDVSAPEVTILIPALNESLTVGEFVDWCKEGLREAGIVGEILIVNSSTDNTGEIALEHGARVLDAPKRGLGRAYLDGIDFARGKYLILGDCDLTYDFRKLSGFIKALASGADYVMGTRLKGYIEEGAMPALHRYFGTPLTTWILNKIYGTKFSDIHCGMRALTKDAFKKMNIQSQSWEYASEMVLKAAKLNLNCAEIPINFYKDRAGRLSHHKRSGWLSPWLAGWINLKAMLVNAPDYFFLKPGLLCCAAGFILALLTALFQPHIGPFAFNLHWLLFFICISIAGFSLFQTAVLGKLDTDPSGHALKMVKKFFTYNRGVLLSLLLAGSGLLLLAPTLLEYFSDYTLARVNLISIFGLLPCVIGIQMFSFSLLLELKMEKAEKP